MVAQYTFRPMFLGRKTQTSRKTFLFEENGDWCLTLTASAAVSSMRDVRDDWRESPYSKEDVHTQKEMVVNERTVMRKHLTQIIAHRETGRKRQRRISRQSFTVLLPIRKRPILSLHWTERSLWVELLHRGHFTSKIEEAVMCVDPRVELDWSQHLPWNHVYRMSRGVSVGIKWTNRGFGIIFLKYFVVPSIALLVGQLHVRS